MSIGCYYGPLQTWKITYNMKNSTGGVMGVALVEADCHQMAMRTFMSEYAGQYTTVHSCKKLLG